MRKFAWTLLHCCYSSAKTVFIDLVRGSNVHEDGKAADSSQRTRMTV